MAKLHGMAWAGAAALLLAGCGEDASFGAEGRSGGGGMGDMAPHDGDSGDSDFDPGPEGEGDGDFGEGGGAGGFDGAGKGGDGPGAEPDDDGDGMAGEREPPPEGCRINEDCGPGYLCIVGRCIFQGDEPLPQDVCRGLPEDRPSADPPPAPGDRYVFLALPSTPALARIDVETLAVDEVPLGSEALAVTTLPGRDLAVVLLGDGRAAVVGAEAGFEPIVTEIEVRQGLTHLIASEVTPHIVAWADHDQGGPQAKNPSEVSVIDLSEAADLARVDPAVYHLSVGARPRHVAFDRAGERLYVVTDDGVSLTELAGLRGDQILPPTPVHDDPVGSDPSARRVLLAPDGAYAVVLQPGEAVLRLVDLTAADEAEPVALALDAPPTDVAFVPDSDPALDSRRVVAVVGDAGQAVLLDVPGDWQGDGLPEVIEIETPVCQVSVSPDGDEAALFSSVGQVPALVRLDLGDGVGEEDRLQVERLAATILGVAWADDGTSAVAFHAGGGSLPLFSMMTFADGFFAKSFAPDGARGRFMFAPAIGGDGVDGDGEVRFLMTVTNPADNRHELLSIPTSSFIPTAIRLRARPEDLGIIEQTNQAYVTQDAPEGLISFITLSEGHETKDVSRFRRNRRID